MKTHTSRFAHLVIAITACLVILTACRKEPDKSAESPQPSIPAETATATEDVAVTVNGVDITESQIDAWLKLQLNQRGIRLQPNDFEIFKKQNKPLAIDGMVVEQLLDEKVKEAGIVVTENDINNYILEMADAQNLSLDDMKALIEASTGQSFEQWKQQLKQRTQVNKEIVYRKLLEAQWEGKINITEEDAEKYYSENKSQFETPEQIRASHILITPDTSDPNIDPNQAKEIARAKAETLREQIRAGADFAEVARLNSSCPSSQRGGDLGFFDRNSQMVPAFKEATFALKTGEISDVVETQFGYHIIKATDHKDPNTATFEEVKEELIKMLKQKRQAELAEEYINSLKANANIVYPPGKNPEVQPSTEPAS